MSAAVADPFYKTALQSVMASKPEWRQNLLLKKNGDPKPILANVLEALRNAPEFAGLLAWDEFKLQVITVRNTPWGSKSGTWTERDDVLLTEWMQREYIDVRPDVVGQAVQTIAHEQSRHVVRDYLMRLRWDGLKRIDGWLSLYLGAEQSKVSCAFGALAYLGRGAHHGAGLQSRLQLDPGRCAGHRQEPRPEDPGWRVVHG